MSPIEFTSFMNFIIGRETHRNSPNPEPYKILTSMNSESTAATRTTKTIMVHRAKGLYGKVRMLEIIVDGEIKGKIAEGQTKLFDVYSTSKEMWAKMDWGETTRIDISDYMHSDYQSGIAIIFKGYFTLNVFRSLGISKIPFKVYKGTNSSGYSITSS